MSANQVFERGDRVGIYLQDKHSLEENVELVQYAEEQGIDEVWQAESRLARDAVSPLGAYAAVTDDIKLGTGVINNWTRNAALIAQSMSTLEELAGPDRIMCGIGAWWDPLAEKVGIDRSGALRAMRECVEVTKDLLDMENVTYEGEFVQMRDVELDVVHGDDGPRTVPVYVGGTGFKMLELTGHFADGALLNYLVSPEYNEKALDALETGAERGDRSLDDIDRPQLVVCSMDHDEEQALDNARELITQYLGQQPHIMKASGVSQDLIDEVGETIGGWPADKDDIKEGMHLIPDDVVHKLTASGTPEQCREKVREYAETGCQCPILYPLGEDRRLMIDEFADGYL
ncbi:LLM class flavin-dependent oxidoreductase [Haloarcula japonica]|uniref:F420-dependent N5,N10-methylene-tetrahydromethanopterin reductase n=1 Tax=Haloarcula japonica (strain ATCC 49778 / DSM 6131 / JCM 7785 / NBRC 101032 / NCIMB 13157 / TR-1) TaxID=1227453 RepID=M0L5H9_HALJT|nr:LLM class flavin-dependent oxidoreductase [Haloarcula japonica]EMA27245.1 F420-dependent N5,N10-methylene-tetrahydromethanopterin reductase [Haloarcula japonica DSM 6131]